MSNNDTRGRTSGRALRGRRTFLKGIGVGTIIATAGCTGGGDGGDGGDGGGDGGGGGGGMDGGDGGGDGGGSQNGNGEPSTPWTTDDLRDMAEQEGGSFTAYFAGPEDHYANLVNAIADEYDADWLSMESISGDGETVGQRMIQEANRGNQIADAGWNMEPPIQNTDWAEQYLLQDVANKYENLNSIADTPIVRDYAFDAHGGGHWYGMSYQEDYMADAGYDPASLHEMSYNALVTTDEYDGITAIQQIDPAWSGAGSAITTHAEMAGMDETEWTRQYLNSFEFVPISSHSSGMRQMIAGEGEIMPMTYVKYPFRWSEEPLNAVMQKKELRGFGAQGYFSFKESPNPWAARFFLSATMEPEIQTWMIDPSTFEYPPVRHLVDDSFDLPQDQLTELQQRILGYGDSEIEIIGTERQLALAQKARDILVPLYEEMGYM